jgi:hypothetical protein
MEAGKQDVYQIQGRTVELRRLSFINMKYRFLLRPFLLKREDTP